MHSRCPCLTNIMKKTLTLMVTGAVALASTNCTTTYDSYGNPRQSVDPGTAAAGVAAAGVLGYALAKDKDNDKEKAKRRDAYNQGYHDSRVGDRRYGFYDRYGRWNWYR